MKKVIFLTIFILSIFLPQKVNASESELNCSNKFITLVNPVRGRDMWGDKTLKPIKDQYENISKYNFPATWLVQYNVLSDIELSEYIKTFDSKHEVGVWLEVNSALAKNARVIYPHGVPWSDPSAIFFSGYSRSDRIKLINKLFKDFNNSFGYFPKSVGAWWIDSYSLSYMKNKYGIESAMIVADQKTTDHYGVWGQWWGLPYFPSKTNILTPARDEDEKIDIAIIQWAQRHPDIAYGEGPIYSNYSFQANDYVRQGKNTDFFKDLTNIYLSCNNLVSQITVGLETGMESIEFNGEYKNQLSFLNSLSNIQFLTMRDFGNEYRKIYPKIEELTLGGKKSKWILSKNERQNKELGDKISYNQNISFADYFVKDKSSFLDRRLTNGQLSESKQKYYPAHFIIWGLISIFLASKRKFNLWILTTLFMISCFGLILMSGLNYGWMVYYGPVIKSLMLIQVVLVMMSFKLFSLIKTKLFGYLIVLSFGIDYLLSTLRYSYFSNSHYLGVMLDNLRFAGLKFISPFSIDFVITDFSSVIASSLLRFNFDKIWNNLTFSLVIYPLVHILIGYVLYRLLKNANLKIRQVVLVVLSILSMFYVYNIIGSDPRIVSFNK